MNINQILELSMVLDIEHFQRIFARVCAEGGYIRELDDEYLDTSLAEKGITVIYRDSRYKKNVRLLVNTALVVDDVSDTDKLIRKLDKRIAEYFNHQYRLDSFTLSGVNLVLNINVGTRANVSDYLKVLRRVGKVKGFSPVSYEHFDKRASFCLSGNSNDIDFLLYDLEQSIVDQLRDSGTSHKEMKAISNNTQSVLRAEVKLKKPKAIRVYTHAEDTAGQITDLSKKCEDMFLDTFIPIIPFGDFYKKDKAAEIIWKGAKDNAMRRKMLRLLALIPEKKSLHLAQKAMDCRNIEKVMAAFAKINLSPVTISKRQDVKHLENLYSYFLDS